MSILLDVLKKFFVKLHFLASLAMFAFIALMVIENDIVKRTFLLLPIVLFYMLSKILFLADQADAVQEIIERQKKRD